MKKLTVSKNTVKIQTFIKLKPIAFIRRQMKNLTTFTQYSLDRDIPVNIWNCYMKKYSDRYVLTKGKDGIWGIKCSFGRIEPFSLKKGYLMFISVMMPTKGKKTYLIKKLPDFTGIIQNGEWEVSFKFLENRLKELETVIKIKKRMQLSKKERKRRREQLLHNQNI